MCSVLHDPQCLVKLFDLAEGVDEDVVEPFFDYNAFPRHAIDPVESEF